MPVKRTTTMQPKKTVTFMPDQKTTQELNLNYSFLSITEQNSQIKQAINKPIESIPDESNLNFSGESESGINVSAIKTINELSDIPHV